MKRILLLCTLTLFLLSACAPAPTSLPPTQTATETATPPPPTATETATVPPPVLSPRQSVECLGGPGAEYPVLAKLDSRVQYKIVGMNMDGTHWIVSLPENDQECWVSVNMVGISGNMSNIPEKRTPPTPTPVPVAAPANLQGQISCIWTKDWVTHYASITVILTWEPVEENVTVIKIFRDKIAIARLSRPDNKYVDKPALYPGKGTIHYEVQNISADGRISETTELYLTYICAFYK